MKNILLLSLLLSSAAVVGCKEYTQEREVHHNKANDSTYYKIWIWHKGQITYSIETPIDKMNDSIKKKMDVEADSIVNEFEKYAK